MRRRARLPPPLVAIGLLAACGQIQPQVALPTPHTGRPAGATRLGAAAEGLGGKWDASLSGLRDQDQRVANVAYRIVTANAALCDDLAPQAGLLLHSALQYSPRLRSAAEATFHIDERPAVEAVAVGGPAEAAGLAVGDIIAAIGEDTFTADPPPADRPDDRPASYAPVARALARLDAAMARGPVRLVVLRGAERREVVLKPTVGCAYDAQVRSDPALNASADGQHVFISSALVSYATSDDMLALVLGHEFAHDLLHHRQRLDRANLARGALGELGSSPASLRLTEREADYVGLYLTARAGYDISHAPDFWVRFPGGGADLGWTHPDAASRAASLAATRDEIWRKRTAGLPLTPTPAGEPTSGVH